MERKQIEGMIRKYNIYDAGNGHIGARVDKATDAIKREIGEAKPEIVKYFAEQSEIATRRRAAEKNMLGLQELRDAIADGERYARQFERMMSDESNDGARPPKAAQGDVKSLKEQYPQAAAFLKAENWSCAANHAKATAGDKARDMILNGEDYVQAIANMESEWSAHCAEHIND